MKIEDYKNAINQLTPGENKKQQIWETITRTNAAGSNKRKKAAGISAAAAALACVFVLSGTLPAIASNVKEFFLGFFTSEQNSVLDQSQYPLSGHVDKELFYDEDGHVGFSVVELLSDGMTAYAALKYTALDQTGQQWLAEQAGQYYLANDLYLNPAYPDDDTSKHISSGLESGLITNLCTDTEKYFYTIMEGSDNEYGSDELILHYAMSSRTYVRGQDMLNFPGDGTRETKIKAVTNDMGFVKYSIQANGQETDKRSQPVCLYVSGLSYKLHIKSKDKQVWNSPEFINSWDITLQFEDGSSCSSIRRGFFGPRGKNKHNALVSGNFKNPDTWQAITFARDEVTKLVYNGAEYDLVRED